MNIKTLLQLFLHLFFINIIALKASDINDVTAIIGQVTDQQTSEPLIGANIELAGLSLGAATDQEGFFRIGNAPVGKHTLRVQFIGYQSIESKIDVLPGKILRLNLKLSAKPLMAPKMVVTATRVERFQRDVPVMVNVADDFIFETSQSNNLAEGLNFLPAVRVETNCQSCGFSQVRINGMEGLYSQILVDSRPVFSALNGVYGLEQIPSAMIERVEVIRGSGSALYGSNAISGIINIITTEPLKNSYDISLNQSLIGGEKSDRNISLNSSLVNEAGSLGIALFGNFRDRAYYDADKDGFSEVTELQSNSFGMRGFYRPGLFSKLTLEMHSLYEDRRGGNRFEYPPHQADIAEALTHNVLGGGFTYDNYFSKKSNKQLTLYTSLQSTHRDSYYGTDRNPNAYGTTKELLAVGGVQLTRTFREWAGKSHQISLVLEGQYNDLDDFQPLYSDSSSQQNRQSHRRLKQQVDQIGFVTEDEWRINDVYSLAFGFRLDRHNKLDDLIFNPRANLLLKLTPQWQFRTSMATGYLAPQTFDEDLHLENIGNQQFRITQLAKDLKPERSLGSSISLDFSKTSGSLPWGVTLEGFYTRLRDVFIEIPIEEHQRKIIYEKRNGHGAQVLGGTLEARMFATVDIELQAGITVQSSRYDQKIKWDDKQPGTARYLRTPGVYGYYLSNWEISHELALSISGVYTGSMLVPHYRKSLLKETPDFLETHLKLSYTFETGNGLPELKINAGVYNLFNSYQSDFDKGVNRDSNYIYGPGRPRTFFSGLQVVY